MRLETVTFEIPEDWLKAIDEIASTRQVDRESLVREALANFLVDYKELCADLDEGLRQLDAGETVSHEEMLAWFNQQRTRSNQSEAA